MTDAVRPLDRLLAIMRELRSEGGCPWDRRQTLETLKPFLVEECYETLDAIDAGDRRRLKEELGDVLLQVVFQAQICAEEGQFTFDDVATSIADKLVRRHPHVFGDVEVSGADEVVRNWDAIKRQEREGQGEASASAVDGVPRSLPALHRAEQVQRRAARVGFDWAEVRQVVDKLDEESAELKMALAAGEADGVREELGDLLFTVVNLSRFVGAHAEDALHATTAKFIRRFRAVEDAVRARGRNMEACSLEELDALWNQAKADESSPKNAS